MSAAGQHIDALLLALASSTDNFTVGVSVGCSRKKTLPVKANLFISVCNATGALVAGYGGVALSETLPSFLAPLLAAIAFGYLSLQELLLFRKNKKSADENANKDDSEQQQEQSMDWCNAIRLAFPMTVNNLAGGVAGGAAGLSPLMTSAYALVASFVTMSMGYNVGRRIGASLPCDPALVSGVLLGLLCLLIIQDTFS
mmetsp:Transcript_1508/g.1926  ORF Transcript_1508/g.1926 Transcript_1508/m.1926 type:complete len:199 (+) Transcript_1508:102-698(+)